MMGRLVGTFEGERKGEAAVVHHVDLRCAFLTYALFEVGLQPRKSSVSRLRLEWVLSQLL